MATHLSSGGQLTHEGCYQRCRQARPCQSQNNSGLNEVDGYLRLRVFIQALRQFQIQELQHFPLSVGCVTDGVHPWSSRISPRGPYGLACLPTTPTPNLNCFGGRRSSCRLAGQADLAASLLKGVAECEVTERLSGHDTSGHASWAPGANCPRDDTGTGRQTGHFQCDARRGRIRASVVGSGPGATV